MIKHSEYLKNKTAFITESGSMTPDLYSFYNNIFLAQEEFTANTGELSGYLKNFAGDSYPVLISENITIDEKIKSHLSDLLLKITDIIFKMNPGMDFSGINKNFKEDADELLHGLLKQDYPYLEKKGIEMRLALDEFIFVIHNVFKPFMSALRIESGFKADKDKWLESICPFCGYLPDMSKIVESKENKKHLHCSICENEWEFPRLVCPACGCDDQTKHGFFEYEDNNLYRVYYCDDCRHYIKNVRIPKLKEESGFDLAVEDIMTSFLDAAMIDKGYKRI